MLQISVSYACAGTAPSRWQPARAPTPTRLHCSARCAAARQSTSTSLSPSSSALTSRFLPQGPAPSLTQGRLTNTRWTCCSTAGRRGVLPSIPAVRWWGHASPADAWRRVEELNNCRYLVAEYDAIASTHRVALLAGPSFGPGRDPGPLLHQRTGALPRPDAALVPQVCWRVAGTGSALRSCLARPWWAGPCCSTGLI